MKIVHIANHVQEVGNGIVNVMVDLACEQARMGHEVIVMSGGGSYEHLLHANGVAHCTLDQTRKPASMLRAFFRFRSEIRRLRPDIIHAHMMTGALLSRYLKGLHSYKIITHVHNEFQKHADLMKVGDAVIAVSDAVAQSMAARGIHKNKLKVVRNGTVGSPRKIQGSSMLDLKGVTIVTVAGLYTRKGIGDLIEAFDQIAAKVEGVELYIVGEGPDRSLFESMASLSFYGNQIKFEGFQHDPMPYMQAADVFVLASHKDPFPLVLIEAREAGCAIVATGVDGIPEALDHGGSGVLVPPRQPAVLAEAVIDLLEDAKKREYFREQARQGLDFYRVKRVAEETLHIYEEVLNR
ncbi:glycosyltransferase family 4 protein [Paenibacillus glycanilyticus]|uniref:glycosyltransferase family 4 protein n=1 Tax=Paenibacillus glycanilyticus TaxID=126569 RepID=UPI003EBC863C